MSYAGWIIIGFCVPLLHVLGIVTAVDVMKQCGDRLEHVARGPILRCSQGP